MTNFNIQYHKSLPMRLLSTFPLAESERWLVETRTLDDYQKGIGFCIGFLCMKTKQLPSTRYLLTLEDFWCPTGIHRRWVSLNPTKWELCSEACGSGIATHARAQNARTLQKVRRIGWGAFLLKLNRTYPSKLCVVPIPVCHLVYVPFYSCREPLQSPSLLQF